MQWPLDDAEGGANALLALLIERSPVGMAMIDRAGLLRSVNPAYCAIFGYAPQDLLGQPFTRLFAAPRRGLMLARHKAFLDNGESIDGEWAVLRSDGETIWVMAQSVRVLGEGGDPRRLVYAADITERKRTEQALQASQQFLHSVLDGLTSHVCVLDASGTIVAVNRAWRQFAEANQGQSDRVNEGSNYLVACENALIGPASFVSAEAGPFLRQMRQVLQGQIAGFQFEYACHAPTEQRWFMARVSRIDGSQPARFVVAHDSVTDLKRTQQTLRDSEALLLDLAASIPGAMFRLLQRATGGWRFVYFSPGVEALFELTPQAVCDDLALLRACILPEDLPAHDRSINEAVAQRAVWEHEYRIRTPGGRLKWVHAQAGPKPVAGGDVVWTGVLTDVTERKHMDAVLQASEEKYRTLFETVPQGVVYHDRSGRITSANPAAQRILGLSLGQLQGRVPVDPQWQALHEDGSDFPGDDHPAMQALRSGQPVRDVVIGVAVPGRSRAWLLVNATPLYHHGRIEEVHVTFEDITERVLMSRELHLQASTDYLTGVANRRGLMERLQLEFDRMQQQPTRRCAVLAADLDLFKNVNDAWGHAAGDAVLQHAARQMLQVTRQKDMVARSGGEEFTLLLPEVDADEALALAERLRLRLEAAPLLYQDQPVPVTLSIGVSLMASDDASPDAALVRADQALYLAKAAGRNAVRMAGPPG